MMPAPGSVTCWLGLLKAGEAQGAQELWDRYFPQLVRLARARLGDVPRREADEEDVAASAFASFCLRAEAGRFPQLADRTDLWKLLVVITARKAADLIARQTTQRQGGGKVRGDSALGWGSPEGDRRRGIGDVVGPDPTPDFAAQVAEEYRRLLDALGDDILRKVAVWKMEGNTNEEIAKKLGCQARTVERKLRAIRHTWSASRDLAEE
jgi:DNA-directed RNA polymerase specialized sigma24 family protein